MFLTHQASGDIVEIMDMTALLDPNRKSIDGCFHRGEEQQDPESFEKATLIFPSGENLPRCWIDPHYRA